MLKFELERKFTFLYFKIAVIDQRHLFSYHNHREPRIANLLNFLFHLILIAPNLLWSILKLSFLLSGFSLLLGLKCFSSAGNKIIDSIKKKLIEDLIVLPCSIISSIGHLCLYFIGIFSLHLQEKISSNTLIDRISSYMATIEENPSAAAKYTLHLLLPKIFFNQHGLNPKKHSELQKLSSPMICVHGYKSNEAAWLAYAKYFEQKQYKGAIHTIRVPSEFSLNFDENTLNTKEFLASKEILKEKIHEVMQKCPGINSIFLVGHSRGSWIVSAVAQELIKNHTLKIHVISLDNDMNYQQFDYPNGHIHIQSAHHHTTHTGMLFHEGVLQQCFNQCQSWDKATKPTIQASLTTSDQESTGLSFFQVSQQDGTRSSANYRSIVEPKPTNTTLAF